MSEAPAETTITQLTFKETPYVDASWEIVGEPPKEQKFTPLELSVVPTERVLSDPMFADYGGHSGGSAAKRWHLPQELAKQLEREESAEIEEAVQPKGVTLLEEELAAIKEKAFAEGKAAGQAEAKNAHEKIFQSFGSRLETILQDLNKQVNENIQNLEQAAVKLSLEVSQKLVGHAVEINPEYIIEIVKTALKSAGGSVVQRVRVSPEDMEFIEIVGIHSKLKAADDVWKFESDESVKAGCIVETSAGELDFQVDKSWERVRDNIMKSIRC